MMKPLLVFGTRPEAIKMAPVVKACQAHADALQAVVCVSGQHREMLQQVTEYFGIEIDVDLEVMCANQSLATLTARCIEGVDTTIERVQPDCVVAQGDTTTVMCAALAAFYRRVPFVHVEAGLRTGNMLAPWPEEMNRRIASLATTLHCAPTKRSRDNLFQEGIPAGSVSVTGNTVIDALLWTVARERENGHCWRDKYSWLEDRRMVLVTGHRRENFGDGFQNICQAIAELARRFPNTWFVYPVHLNPNVREPVGAILSNHANIRLLPPLAYPEFVWLMDRSDLILTDSGGIQEEAPSLKKPVVVMRETTERPEALDSGAVELVGTCVDTIVGSVSRLLQDSDEYKRRQVDVNPYGDGRAAERIVELMLRRIAL